MQPNKKKKAFNDAILREVKKEMAKPRIAQSAREASVDPGGSDERCAEGINPGRLSDREKAQRL